MSVCDLYVDVEYLEGEINWFSREIYDFLWVMNFLG